MERRLSNKVQNHIVEFKRNVLRWFTENDIRVCDNKGTDCITMLETYMGNYKDITFTKEDFLKRKRVKNMAPHHERCIAKRADGTQCTRRKKCGDKFCGTHTKGTPHGVICNDGEHLPTTKKIVIETVEIMGIYYHIDDDKNVYNTEDIMSNSLNPRIIAKWEKIGDKYTIPELGI